MTENIKRGNDIDMLFRSAVNMLAEEQGQADLEKIILEIPAEKSIRKLKQRIRSARFGSRKRRFAAIAACAAALLICFSMIGSLSFYSGSSDMASNITSDSDYRYLLEQRQESTDGILDVAGSEAAGDPAMAKENEDSISQYEIAESQTRGKNMNKNIKIFLAMAIAIILICCLAACANPAVTSEKADPKTGENCGHALYDGDNIVPHDAVGYCGNIQMTVKYAPMGVENDNWEKMISGSPAVELTDLFMWLDYSEPTCDCAPEYTVISEGGEVYGFSLTEGYARHGDLQVSLTESQVTALKETMTTIAEYEGDMLMYRQVEE